MSTHFIPEDLLRHLWSKHYLSAEPLQSTDGASIVVRDCGVLNRDTGPDFHNAVIDIDGVTCRGDVEFHRSLQDWQAHRHERDPRYNRVILHVVLNKPDRPVPTKSESGRVIPVLILSGALTMPVEKFGDALARDEYASYTNAIPCYRTNDTATDRTISQWLSVLAVERLTTKSNRFDVRLGEILTAPDAADTPSEAWEQLLYEGIMDCLGYAKNRIPCMALGREISIGRLKKISALVELQPFDIQSMLLTYSGLLPDVSAVDDQQSKVVLHQLRSTWNAVLQQLCAHHAESLTALPAHLEAEWTFAPLRPSNFPAVRLAAASVLAHRIVSDHFFDRIIGIVAEKFVTAEFKHAQLRDAFDPGSDAFWSFHYSFTEASSRAHALLGSARIDDIIINAVIPIAILYGRITGHADIAEHAMNLARELPLCEENRILRRMDKQLLRGKVVLTTAFQQQGALQLHAEYCMRRRCTECDIGKELRMATG